MSNRVKQKVYDGYEDCVHVHACRRARSICETKFRKHLTLYCDAEECTAYETADDLCGGLYTRDEVQKCINAAAQDALNGYTDNIVEDYI